MAAASVTPPGSLDVLQPGFSKTLLGTKPEDKYLCSACRNVLRRPFQAQCGHRYCSYCLTSILSSGPQNCAACVHEGIYEEGISILESGSAFPDNAARREVESLPAVCPSDGCTWKGTLKEYESCHEGHCPFMLTECPACRGLVRLGEKERHSEQECPERSLSCRHCRAPCCWADLKAHHEVCPKFPLTCDGCGKKKISREKFQDHVRACGRCRVPCRFRAVGCPEMVESEKQQQHEAQWLREHLAMLLGGLLEARHPSGADGRFLGQGEVGGWEAGTLHPEAELPKAAELQQRCEALERKTATFENIVCVLNREVERVAMTAEACGRQHRLDQDRIEALSSKVQQLERSIGLKDLAMAELEQKVHEMEASTFDGVFIWKISDFARKRQEAVAGRTPAIFSPGAVLEPVLRAAGVRATRAPSGWRPLLCRQRLRGRTRGGRVAAWAGTPLAHGTSGGYPQGCSLEGTGGEKAALVHAAGSLALPGPRAAHGPSCRARPPTPRAPFTVYFGEVAAVVMCSEPGRVGAGAERLSCWRVQGGRQARPRPRRPLCGTGRSRSVFLAGTGDCRVGSGVFGRPAPLHWMRAGSSFC